MQDKSKSILLEFEKAAFSTSYAEYFAVKRNNFFANVQRFSQLWQCFMALDEIWMQEFADLRHLTDPNAGLPASLFMHAHALFRLALEAAFTGSLAECRNLFRMAIESAYQACLILEHAALATVWTKACRGSEATKEFEQAFNQDKRKKFETLGLMELHKFWQRYSDWGHIGVNGLGGTRLNMDVSRQKIEFSVQYFETDEKVLLLALMDFLYVSHLLEKAFFERFQARLTLDPRLVSSREAFLQKAEGLRRDLIQRNAELFRSVMGPESKASTADKQDSD